MPTPTIFWFRRDLRLSDQPALEAAVEHAGKAGSVIGLFINDPKLTDNAGANRLAYAAKTLQWLNQEMGGALVYRTGKPLDVLTELIAETGAEAMFATDDFGPYGRARDTAVGKALAAQGVHTQFVGTNYAVAPGSVVTGGGTPYKVFTPFFRAWKTFGWDEPGGEVKVKWHTGLASEEIVVPKSTAKEYSAIGAEAAWARAEEFLDGKVNDYPDARNWPGTDGTSGLSPFLKWGVIHPRQLLAKLGADPAEDVFRSELAWREFYAEVLFMRPTAARESLSEKMSALRVDTDTDAKDRFKTWTEGKTGYPIVDAGMRQLLETGWMHNRVRMIVASFLIKDLHLPWQWGARHFMDHLVDGDLASNSLGWQWVAGTGTDASPFYRVFNPTSQSKKFDASGSYLRRWIPEIAHMTDADIHEPSACKAGIPAGYELPMVNHAEARIEALDRLAELKK